MIIKYFLSFGIPKYEEKQITSYFKLKWKTRSENTSQKITDQL
jgi:hypothetical protein